MTLRLARSNDEAYLYMARVACPQCGATGAGEVTATTSGVRDGVRFRTFELTCGSCGTVREFTFQVPETPAPQTGRLSFGDERPSELLDPGEWLTLADTMLSSVPEDPTRLPDEDRARAREDLEVARAALDEVLKFIPADRTAVPRFSFWTEQGQRLSVRERWRFDRQELVAQRSQCERLLLRLSA